MGGTERNAKIFWRDIVLGSKFTQLDVQTALICPQSQVEASSGYFGKGTQTFDLYSEAKHMSSNTECTLYNRGVLCDTARTVTRGKITIEKNNPKCKF